MLEEKLFSKTYDVRKLDDNDVNIIFNLCNTNPTYYEYCNTGVEKEDILRDLHLVPPGTTKSQKYFVGYFENDRLLAVMDMIEDYPSKQECYIGFFMVDGNLSGKNIGTLLIDEIIEYLIVNNKKRIELAYEISNPQASRFWQKNEFIKIKEIEHKYGHMVVAERIL